jgi:type I restriction enzyme S subunit
MAAVDEVQGVIADLQTRPYRKVKRGYTYFEEGDVLFAKITPSMQNGKSVITRGLIDSFGFGSTEFHVLRPSSRVIPEWVHLFVRQKSFRDEAMQHFRGAIGQQRVPAEFLESYSFPLPPLDEQRRIVARIEELFARIEEARRLRAAADQDAEELMTAELAEVFPDPENELPKGWHLKHVAEISEKPQYGYTQPAQDEPIGPKFLRITDIQDGQVNWETVPFCLCAEKELEKYRLEPGDIVFARSGATTGKTFLVEECPEAVFASYLIRLKVRGVIVPAYVYWFFQSPYYWRQVKPRGAAQPNMNARILSGLKVPIPGTPAEQHRIVEYLDGLQAQVAELKHLQMESVAELERLSGAVLARAFRGEL